MRAFVWNILLAAAWMVFTERYTTVSFAIGFAMSYVLLWFIQPMAGRSPYFGKTMQVTRFLLFFIKELIVANIKVAYHVLTPPSFFKPAVIAIPLEEQSPIEATLVANLITLTPGSFSIDISSDQKTLYVHVMDVDNVEKVRREIKDYFEKRLLEVLR